jgi:hypothetical protein
MPTLSDALNTKIKSSGKSATALARSVGLSLPSFRAALAGKSAPNARSAKKYAKLLGISEDQVFGLAGRSAGGAKPAAKGKAAKAAKPVKAEKAPKGKPGRKPGKAAKAVKPAKVEAKPAKAPKGKPGRKAAAPKAAVVSPKLIKLAKLGAEAKPVLKDKLALAVHGLGKKQRAAIKAIVKSLS